MVLVYLREYQTFIQVVTLEHLCKSVMQFLHLNQTKIEWHMGD
jgi:hypothetical protein